jgi:YVTN family beta-propeller protein
MPFISAMVRSHRAWTRLALSLLAMAFVPERGSAEAQMPKAYVARTGADSVAVVDTTAESVVGTLPAGAGPRRVAISNDGTRAYVLNREADSITVIDTLNDIEVATIAVGDNPGSLAVTPDGSRVYVVLPSGIVQVVDTSLNAVVAEISTEGNGDYGSGIAITPDGAYAFVAAGNVTMIETATDLVAHDPIRPDSIALDERVPKRALAANLADRASIVGPYVRPYRYNKACPRKKPNSLLDERAARQHRIDVTRSFVVGDSPDDVRAARRLGAKGCLVRTGWARDMRVVETATSDATVVVESLTAAVDWILAASA